MFPYDEILAKSNPRLTLLTHTQDCFDWFPKVVRWKAQLITVIAEKYDLSEEKLLKRLFLTVAFHDIGKATKRFQDKIRGLTIDGLESHALASVPFIYQAIKNEPLCKLDEEGFYPEALAIASHHTRLHKELFSGHKTAKVTYAPDAYFERFYEFVNKTATELPDFPEWQTLVFDPSITQKNSPYNVLYDEVFRSFLEYGSNKKEQAKFRDLFLLFKSVLHYCDWLASGHRTHYQYSHQLNAEVITDRMRAITPNFIDWAPFQRKAAETPGNILVQIPTGQGKTEASVLWAVNGKIEQKILFLLPTMVTTNKMWKRAKNFFGSDEIVGLSHGASQYVLRNEETEIEDSDFRVHVLYNKSFFKPVTVATIDQLIYSFFNWGQWVLTGAAAYNSCIIIDEIHIYDAYTFGLILQVLECIQPFPTRFAIMSASLPNVLREKIEDVIPEFTLIADSQFDHRQRHVIEVKDIFIEECINEILEDYKKGLKVLIVCNTIAKAREIFDMAKSSVPAEKRMLYHSQFILKDKNAKEKRLEDIKNVLGGFIAICTQIVEVSLDIDFDTLYTENAPIDAIIQRLGRVNRKGAIAERLHGKQFARVVITKPSEKSVKYVYKKVAGILSLTYDCLIRETRRLNGNLQEQHLKAIVDEIYTKENLGSDYESELAEARSVIKNIWDKLLKGIFTLSGDEKTMNSLSSRTQEYITVEAVLIGHNQTLNFEELLKKHQYDLVREYTLKIPLHLTRNRDYKVKKLADTEIYLMDLAYNSEEGLSLRPDDQNMF